MSETTLKEVPLHCKLFAAPLPAEECVQKLKEPATFLCFDESVMQWKKASSFSSYTIQLDDLECGLIIKDADTGTTERYLSIEQISDIRDTPFVDESPDTPVSEEQLPVFLSIAHYKGERDLVNVLLFNLIAQSEEVAQIWRRGLHHIVSQNSFNSPRIIYFPERRKWMYAECIAQASDGTLTTDQVAKYISKDCKNIVADFVEKEGWEVDKKKFDASLLTLEKFTELLEVIYPRPDLSFAFENLFDDDDVDEEFSENSTIKLQQLMDFLQQTQRDPRLNEILAPIATEDDCKAIIATYETDPKNRDANLITVKNLNEYLMTDPKYGSARDMQHHELYQDMTKPLAHYFINSSHNTYLTGGQLSSKSTFEVYRQCLLSRCRCVEIDIWDGQDGEPEVTHGRTMCTRIPFEGVIKAVGEYSFVNSEWPVILSFENHCSPPQMRKMAAYCKQYLGTLLQSEFLEGDGYDTLPNDLPSPIQLRHRIIIKNKKRKLKTDELANDIDQLVIDGEVIQDDDDEIDRIKERSGEIAKELSDLVNYCTPFHFKNFAVARHNSNPYHISSFAEKRGLKLLTGKPEDFIDYNKHQLSRIYPNGTRINSSNYNPQIFWNVGCQLVALNWQTCDVPMQLNHGKFKDNGRSGYLLKPVLYTNPQKTYNPFNRLPIDEVVPLSVKVKVHAVHGVIRKSGAPYVEVQFLGIPADSKKHHYKTRPARGKGFSPRWKADNEFGVERLILPHLAHIRFAVFDSKDDKCLGWECIPLESIHSGFRYITLTNGISPIASVFAEFNIQIYIMSAHAEFAEILTNPLNYLKPSEMNMLELEDLLDEDEDAKEELKKLTRKSTLSFKSKGDTQALDFSGKSTGEGSLGMSQAQQLSDDFGKSIDDHVTEAHVPLHERTADLIALKQVAKLKASHAKVMDKKTAETMKAMKSMQKQAISALRKAHKAQMKEVKSALKAAKGEETEAVTKKLAAGFEKLIGLEQHYLENVFKVAENHMADHRYTHASRHHDQVAEVMKGALSQMHQQEEKQFKKFLNSRWNVGLSNVDKKDKETKEALEKKMKRLAVSSTNRLMNLTAKDQTSFDKKLDEKKEELKMASQREKQAVVMALDQRVEKLQSFIRKGYAADECSPQWSTVNADKYVKHLQESGRLDLPVLEDAS